MNTLAKLVLVALSAVILTGCGGGLRVIKPEVDDAAGLRAVSAYHVKPVSYDFEVPADWEIPANEWPNKTRDWNSAYGSWVAQAGGKPVYILGTGADSKDGAIIETSVTSMRLGTYAFFVKSPGRINGRVTITDAKSGKVLFKGSFDAMGDHEGSDILSYEGRVKTAHRPVAADLRWLIERQE